MSDITSSKIKNAYKQLLQCGAIQAGLTASIQAVQDGDGTASGLGLSTDTTKIGIGGFDVTATGTTSIIGTNTGDQLLFKTIAVSGQSDIVADTTTDTLTLAAGSGVTLTTNASTDTVTITNSNTSFGTIAVSGQSDVVADALSDTLTLAAGSGITLTTNASTDTVTITSSATGTLSNAVQKFTSGSGTYTPTSGTKFIRVRMSGGGKGGGGVSNAGAYASATGGNSGGFLEFTMTAAQIGASLSYGVGGGGAGGSSGANAGTNGSDTTFGDWTAKGGTSGGNAMAGAATNPVLSAIAGSNTANTAGTGTVIHNIAGNRPELGMATSVFGIFSKGGANDLSLTSVLPPSINLVLAGVSGNAAAAEVYGRGGDGAVSPNSSGNFAGGAGSAGVIIIEEFIFS